jgi:hypothetical protein
LNDERILSDAIRMAITDFASNRILAEFLKPHGSEVFNMMSAEFKMEEALRVRFEYP